MKKTHDDSGYLNQPTKVTFLDILLDIAHCVASLTVATAFTVILVWWLMILGGAA